MYATIRAYQGNRELANALVERQDDVRRLISEIDGFKAYYLLSIDEGTATVSVFDSKEGVEASTAAAAAWLADNLPDMAASPYVAGLAVLADDEADLGAIVVDMGAGTTTIAAFQAGRLVYVDGFALGGHHVTMDLARGLNAGITDAERIKTLYGTVLSGGSDERDMITVPPLEEHEREQAQLVSRATLVSIIKPRVEEILEMVRDKLAASPFAAEPRGHVILTGGASQLTGLPDLAARILGRPVRIGRPLGIAGLPEAAKGSAFAVAAGLLVYPQAAHLEHFEQRRRRPVMTGTGGYFARVGQWLRESF